MSRIALAALALVVPALVSCGDAAGEADTTLTVFAAASLQDTFEELGARFESEHEGVEVTFNFAGSSDLVAQVQQGADADVIATADTETMQVLVEDDLLAAAPQDFATNTLEIAVPPGNPAGVETFDDLADDDVRLVACAPEVPCGAAATQVAEQAGVDLSPVSEEQSVTDVLNKVITGEADAGLVYVTDVAAAGDQVEGVPFPESEDVVNRYPIATVGDSEHADLAEEFEGLVRSEEGQQVLGDAGFAAP